jgi:hypothetical protein
MAVRGLHDLLAGFVQNNLIVGVLPENQPLDDPEEPLPLRLLRLLGGKLFGTAGRIVNDGCKEHRSAGCQRPARPPEVQRGGMAVADGLLPSRGYVDGLQGQGDLDELLAVRHVILLDSYWVKLKILSTGGPRE